MPFELNGEDWAAQQLLELVCSDAPAALEVIEEVLSETQHPWVLTSLGAGPVEDLLAMSEDEALPQLARLAERHQHVRDVLRNVSTSGLSDRARAFVQARIGAG